MYSGSMCILYVCVNLDFNDYKILFMINFFRFMYIISETNVVSIRSNLHEHDPTSLWF